MVTIVFPSWAGCLTIATLVVFFVCCVYIGRPQKPSPAERYEVAKLRAETEWLRAERKQVRARREAWARLEAELPTMPVPTVLPVTAPTRDEPTLADLFGQPPVHTAPRGRQQEPAHIWDPNTQSELAVQYAEPFKAGSEMAN